MILLKKKLVHCGLLESTLLRLPDTVCDTVSCFHQLSDALWSRGSLKFIFVLDDGANGALIMIVKATQLGDGCSFLILLDDFLFHSDCNRLSRLRLRAVHVAECCLAHKTLLNKAKQGANTKSSLLFMLMARGTGAVLPGHFMPVVPGLVMLFSLVCY